MSILPDDLADLERRLAAAARRQPDAALRQRVLASVQDELRREVGASTNDFGRFAAALAATVLLGANLSLSAALNMNWPRDGGERDDLAATAAQIRRLDPELSEQEARQQAALLHARSHLLQRH
jgi:hypothetical protein